MTGRTGLGWSAVLLGAFLLVAMVFAQEAVAVTAADHPYIALGDSYSLGYSASSPATGFVGLLYTQYQSSLDANQLSVKAVPGESAHALLNGGQLTSALAEINSESDTKAVTLDTGGAEALLGNQCTGHWDGPGACAFRGDFSSIVSQLKNALANDPGDEVFAVLAYPNPAQGSGSPNETTYANSILGSNGEINCADTGSDVGLDDVIFQESDALGVPVANPYPAFVQHGQEFWDQNDSMHLHPNDAGYAAIAASFAQAGGCPAPPDTTPPDTIINSGPSGKTGSRSVTFEFSGSPADDVTKFMCKLDSAEFVDCANPVTFPNLANGEHTVSIRAEDAAGNQDQTPATRTFKVVEPAKPVVTITGRPGNVTRSRKATFRFKSSVSGVSFECRLDGKAFKRCKSPAIFRNLKSGRHTFRVRAKLDSTYGPTSKYGWTIRRKAARKGKNRA